MRMHWQMSTDVMAVVAHTSDAQAARMEAMTRGQKPTEKAADAAATPNEPAQVGISGSNPAYSAPFMNRTRTSCVLVP